MTTAKQSLKFICYPLSDLQQSGGRAVPRSRKPAFLSMCHQVQSGKEVAVVTHQGEVLAFLAAELPEPLASMTLKVSHDQAFSKSCLVPEWFKSLDVTRLSRYGRFRFWLVPSSYQAHMGLPLVQVKQF